MSRKPLVGIVKIGPITLASIHASSLTGGPLTEAILAELRAYVHPGRGLNLLLDFHRVQHLSLGFFVELRSIQQSIESDGGSLGLCALRKDVLEVLRVLELDSLYLGDSARHALPQYVSGIQGKNERGHGVPLPRAATPGLGPNLNTQDSLPHHVKH